MGRWRAGQGWASPERSVLKLLSWSSFCQEDLDFGGTEISTEQWSRAGHRGGGETGRKAACGPSSPLRAEPCWTVTRGKEDGRRKIEERWKDVGKPGRVWTLPNS